MYELVDSKQSMDIKENRRIKNIPYVIGTLILSSILLSFFNDNSIVVLGVILLFIFLLLKKGIMVSIFAYIYLGVWEEFTTLPFASGISLVCIILGAAIVLNWIRTSFILRIEDIVLVIFFGIMGAWSFVAYKDFSGIPILADCIIALYIKNVTYGKDNEKRHYLWKNIFFFIFISSVVSIVWGIVTYLSGNVAYVYLNSMYIPRMRAVIGTDRTCMLYCAAMIFPLFYMHSKKMKVFFCTLFLVAILMTFSITAIGCLGIFIAIKFYFDFKEIDIKKKKSILVIVLFVVIWLAYVWCFGSNISIVNTIVQRGHKILELVQSGEVASATSGRTEIWSSYMEVFNSSNTFNKLFGTGVTNYFGVKIFDKYAHNSYIDMLLYMGIIPCLFFVWYSLQTVRILKRRDCPEYAPVLLMKVVYMVTAVSVSIFPAPYWWIVILM